jgi:hypothetical protein
MPAKKGRPCLFTAEQVREFRRQHEIRLASKSIARQAKEAGIHTAHMSEIVNGRIYKWVR